jgi:tetratricopeptide (TPR) repeat protein
MPEEVKDRELRALEDRVSALSQRLVEVEEGQAQSGQGATELAAEVRQLADGLRRHGRLLGLHSFAAYFIFTVLLCAAFYFLYARRAGEADLERDRALAARDAAVTRADAAQRELAARARADRAAAELLELLRQRRYREAIAAERALGEVELGAAQRQFLVDAVRGARAELVADATARARHSYDRRDYERARAVAADGLAIAAGNGPELTGASADLRYVLAAALDRLGRPAEAIDAYGAFLAAAPDHSLARRARQRVAWLERIRSPRQSAR